MPVLKLPSCQLASQIYHDRTSCHLYKSGLLLVRFHYKGSSTHPKEHNFTVSLHQAFNSYGRFAYAKHDFGRTILALLLVGVSSNQVFYDKTFE